MPLPFNSDVVGVRGFVIGFFLGGDLVISLIVAWVKGFGHGTMIAEFEQFTEHIVIWVYDLMSRNTYGLCQVFQRLFSWGSDGGYKVYSMS